MSAIAQMKQPFHNHAACLSSGGEGCPLNFFPLDQVAFDQGFLALVIASVTRERRNFPTTTFSRVDLVDAMTNRKITSFLPSGDSHFGSDAFMVRAGGLLNAQLDGTTDGDLQLHGVNRTYLYLPNWAEVIVDIVFSAQRGRWECNADPFDERKNEWNEGVRVFYPEVYK